MLAHQTELQLHFLRKLCINQNFMKEHFHLSVLQEMNYVMQSVGMNILTVFPNCIQL
jgi:hypothetical protein